VQALVLSFDVLVIVLVFSGYFAIKGMICSFTYSIKLELEFVILNQLVATSRQGIHGVMSIPMGSESGMQDANDQCPRRRWQLRATKNLPSPHLS
jgi:hypothetical protein